MVQTAIFRQLVRDHMRRTPALVPLGTTCAEAVRRMAEAAVDSVLIIGPGGAIRGILTEQDVTRRLAFKNAGTAPVEAVMSAPVLTIQAQDYLYHAIAVMRRVQLRHMPVVDATGVVVGLLHLHEALAVASGQLLRLIDRLALPETLEGLQEVKAAQVEVAEVLFADNVPAAEIQTLMSDMNRHLYRRVLALSLAAMSAAGWGEPPVPFALIVMGSCGRGESHLQSDQDNGFILADYPDAEHNRIDPYFIGLATRLTETLEAVGMPRCQGNVMATNPLWRKTLSQWCAQTTRWVQKGSDVAIRHADIFFDFQPVEGDVSLAHTLRQHVTRLLTRNTTFLRAMYTLDADHQVALGWFGRLRPERRQGIQDDRINLKYRGTLPLVEGVRLFALREGIVETPTLRRLDLLRAQGILDVNEHDYLSGAFCLLTTLLLRQQISDFQAGRAVSNLVPLAALSQRENDMLVDAFRAITAFRERVRVELTGQIL
jgi:signal-transduction protein with cAMP-binding, CBS, and nucleotidyltransferase domain